MSVSNERHVKPVDGRTADCRIDAVFRLTTEDDNMFDPVLF